MSSKILNPCISLFTFTEANSDPDPYSNTIIVLGSRDKKSESDYTHCEKLGILHCICVVCRPN